MWSFIIALSVSTSILWWVHASLNHHHDPLEGPFDTFLHGFCSASKYVIIIALPFAIGQVARRCFRSPELCARALIFWTLFGCVLFIFLNIFRLSIANILNSSTIRFYPVTPLSENEAGRWPGFEIFLWRSQHGVIFYLDVAGIAVGASGMAYIAYRWGNRTLAGLLSVLWLGIFTILYGFLFGLVKMDYDFFYADELFGPVAMDIISFPFGAISSASEVAFVVYAAVILSCYALDLFLLPKKATKPGEISSSSAVVHA